MHTSADSKIKHTEVKIVIQNYKQVSAEQKYHVPDQTVDLAGEYVEMGHGHEVPLRSSQHRLRAASRYFQTTSVL